MSSAELVRLGASLPVLSILGPSPVSNSPFNDSGAGDSDAGSVGNGFRSQFTDDIASLVALGVSDLRLGFDWSRLQPRPGDFDGQWVEWYADVLASCAAQGVRVWAILLERTVPMWFDDERGFHDTKTAGRHWPRFVEQTAEIFGDRIHGWFPIDDPIGFAARTEPNDARRHGEMIDTLVVAWRDAWRILHGAQPIATSLSVRHVRPTDESPQASERARREDLLRVTTFLQGLRDGTIVIPGRADRTLADLAGAVDVIGIKMRTDLADDAAIDDESLRRWQERSQMLIRRAVDEGPGHPLVISYRVNRRSTTETPRDAEVLAETFIRSVEESRSDGVVIDAVFVEPAIAVDRESGSHALLDWDRKATTLADTWMRHLRSR